jgi:hypothetical protein
MPDIDSVHGWRCRTMIDCIGSIEKNYTDDRNQCAPRPDSMMATSGRSHCYCTRRGRLSL